MSYGSLKPSYGSSLLLKKHRNSGWACRLWSIPLGWRKAERGLDGEGRDQTVICGPATPSKQRISTSLALPNIQNIPNLCPQGPRLPGPVRYNPDCYSFHPSLISPFQLSCSYSNTQARSSSGPFLSPPPGLHSARPLYAQALTLLLHHSKFTSGEWHFLSSVPGTQYPRDISIPGCTKRKPSSFP